jgi:hypothetical protein
MSFELPRSENAPFGQGIDQVKGGAFFVKSYHESY